MHPLYKVFHNIMYCTFFREYIVHEKYSTFYTVILYSGTFWDASVVQSFLYHYIYSTFPGSILFMRNSSTFYTVVLYSKTFWDASFIQSFQRAIKS